MHKSLFRFTNACYRSSTTVPSSPSHSPVPPSLQCAINVAAAGASSDFRQKNVATLRTKFAFFASRRRLLCGLPRRLPRRTARQSPSKTRRSVSFSRAPVLHPLSAHYASTVNGARLVSPFLATCVPCS